MKRCDAHQDSRVLDYSKQQISNVKLNTGSDKYSLWHYRKT